MAGIGRGARWGRLALVIGALGLLCTTLHDGAYRLIWQPLALRG